MILRFNKKQDLIDALEKQRRICKRIDAAEKRKRLRETEKAMALISKRLKQRAKWSLKQWDKADFRLLNWNEQPANHCAPSMESELDVALAIVKASAQERFTVRERGVNSSIYRLLALGLPSKKSICG